MTTGDGVFVRADGGSADGGKTYGGAEGFACFSGFVFGAGCYTGVGVDIGWARCLGGGAEGSYTLISPPEHRLRLRPSHSGNLDLSPPLHPLQVVGVSRNNSECTDRKAVESRIFRADPF